MRTNQGKAGSTQSVGRNLSEQAKEANRKYQRDYYKKNRDKVRSWQAGYWERKAATEAEKEIAED